jgi:hypothetical protein
MANPQIDTDKLLQACERPFAYEEHAYIKKKDSEDIESVYILKDAIRRRLMQIDPHWTTGAPDLMGIQGDVVIMRGVMTFLGAQRTAVGTGKITRTRWDKKQNKRVEIEGYDLAREESKAMKTAVSDLLPRLATEWNIGGYLRQMPRNITTEATFKMWLETQVKAWEGRYHWASNGKGQLFWQLIKAHGLTWEIVKKELEPGRELSGLRDIGLTDVEAFTRLVGISLEHAKS